MAGETEINYLELAEWVGRRLVSLALLEGDTRAFWLSFEPPVVTTHQPTRLRPCGSDLYGGSSGIGLFLARLAQVTGDHVFRDYSRAAFRHAFAGIERLDPSAWGLFSGCFGVSWSGLVAAEWMEDAGLAQQAGELLATIEAPAVAAPLDVVSGLAGFILGSWRLRDLIHQSQLFELSVQAGEELLRAAIDEPGGACSWRTIEDNERSLTGFAHGAAGIALALYRLSEWTGEERFLKAAIRGVLYEDTHFDLDAANWPDFREEHEGKYPCSYAWCHGAPGILLSRAAISGGVEGWGGQAQGFSLLAWEQMKAVMTHHMMIPGSDWSWCHGVGGLLEIALIVSPSFSALSTEAELGDSCASVARKFRDGTFFVRSGVASGMEDPGLMLGLAGLGGLFLTCAGHPLGVLEPSAVSVGAGAHTAASVQTHGGNRAIQPSEQCGLGEEDFGIRAPLVSLT